MILLKLKQRMRSPDSFDVRTGLSGDGVRPVRAR
jgi:hypothetical protein